MNINSKIKIINSFQYNLIQEVESHISLLPYNYSDSKKLVNEWQLNDIKEIQRKRYILKKKAVEIFLNDGSTLLFFFPNGDQEEFLQKLLHLRKSSCQNLVYYKSLDPKKLPDKSGIINKDI